MKVEEGKMCGIDGCAVETGAISEARGLNALLVLMWRGRGACEGANRGGNAQLREETMEALSLP